ncbi:hypothetical protein CYMTET_39129 [Cymbomonas tetramitiformis]|uniref:AMP-dependent synthetase/ligase domain-containing protein n=1 Tax=Cymbomonas tetramitiformis TaxID=36881 RepID=A0AAE0CCD7_9CHLO|nr:hypothetical protein CYMTET_39129 [Cymbomonas tetramitiformis]
MVRKASYTPSTTAQLPQYSTGVHFVTEPNETRPIVLSSEGPAAEAPVTVMQVLKEIVAGPLKDTPALRQQKDPKESPATAAWKIWSWSEYYADIIKVSKTLIHLGFQSHDCVNIIGFNSPEWHLANMGAIAAGGVAAGIYTTNLPDACKYISAHSNAKVVVVEGVAQLKKFLTIRDSLPSLAALVVYGEAVPDSANEAGKVPVYSWEAFLELGSAVSETDVNARIDGQKPGDLCTLIYTSGTTGPPKAVMLSHDNVTWTQKGTILHSPHLLKEKKHAIVSYLPLSHIAAQSLDIHLPQTLARLGCECLVTFARPDALKGSLKDTLVASRPTLFFGVPRVWEKFAEGMKAVGATIKGTKAKISAWGKRLGAKGYDTAQLDTRRTRSPFGHAIASKLVFSKAKAALGLDRCMQLASGAAPISMTTLEYFGQLNIYIQEVYGMSENTGPHCAGKFDYFIAGTCGIVLPGVETKIDHVAGRDPEGEGEICMRGRHVMLGYMKDPEKTKAVIDAEGYLHSGDVGRVDPATGILKITGRIKELIITAGGENIAPVPIEEAIKKLVPAVSNVMLVGDRQKYNSVLITLMLQDDGEGGFTDKLVRASTTVSDASKTVAEAKNDPKWKEYIEAGIKAYNSGETCVSNAQKVQKFAILDSDFSIPGGELTPTMKLKRDIVCSKYESVISTLYAE